MAVVPTWRPRPRDRGRPGRGDRPDPRLRGDPAGHLPDTLDAGAIARSPLARPRPGPRDARRGRPDRGRHLTPWSRRARSSASPAGRRRPATALPGDDPAGGPADRGDQPAVEPSTPSCARTCSAACSTSLSTEPAPGPRRRGDLRDRQGLRLRRGDRPVHEWWRLGLVADRRGRAARPGTGRPRPYDLDDAKGLVELLAARLRLPAPAWTPARPIEPILPPRPGARRGLTPEAICAAGSASCIRPSGAARPASRARRRRRARDPRAGRRAAARRSGSTPIATLPGGRARPGRRRRRSSRRAGEVEARDPPAGGALLRDVRLFDVYRGAPLADDEQEPGLSARSRPTTGP